MKKNKYLIFLSLILGLIIGSVSISPVQALVFGSANQITQWIKDATTVRLRTETDSVRVGSNGVLLVNTGSSTVSVNNQLFAPMLYGTSTSGGNLTLDSTSNATKGYVLLNPTGGNVGIGTTAPGAKLDVQGNAIINSGAGNIRSLTLGASGGRTGVKANLVPDLTTSILKFDDSGTPSVNKWVFYEKSSWVGGVGFSTNSFDLLVGPSGDYTFYTGTTNVDGTGASPIFKIQSTGNVGIGTTAPQEKLSIYGNMEVLNSGIMKQKSNTWGDKWWMAGSGIKVVMDETSTSWLTTFGGNTGLTKFRWSSTKAGGINGPILDLETGGNAIFYGNVGIGTSTPASALHINQASATSTLIIDAGGTNIACFKMKDSDGAGYTYITANNGVLTATTTSCQ